MNFTIKRSDLLLGVQTVINAVSSRSTLPILSNILFESEKDILKLSATDLEVSIRCQVPAEIHTNGTITIPAKRLSEIVRELPDQDIVFAVKDQAIVHLTCGKSIFKINGLPKDDFPILPKIKNDKGLFLGQKTLNEMIRKTIFSVSNDETRYVLNGILFVVENEMVRLVSTDGHRLSFIEKKLEKSGTQKFTNIVPAKALQELSKVLEDEGEINIQINENQIIFSMPQVILMSRLIDGQFPNYDQVIPKQSDKTILSSTDQLLSATRRVALMASDKSNSIKFSASAKKLMISSITPEVGEAQEELEVKYDGDTITIAFNAKYVIDVLKNLGSSECALELTTNLNPGILRPSDKDQNYLCVVMPMRI